jgi:hypothetical protein
MLLLSTPTHENNQNDRPMKRLFFAHLILIPVIRLSEPMHVFTTDDAHCFFMFSESFASTYFGVANVFPYKLII